MNDEENIERFPKINTVSKSMHENTYLGSINISQAPLLGITGVQFELLDPVEFRKQSIEHIYKTQFNTKNVALPHTINSAALGPIEQNQLSQCCQSTPCHCDQHFGHFELLGLQKM